MNSSTPLVNAWIFLNEDEPPGTTYNDPKSCFQTLITDNVYQSVDILCMAFVDTVPTSATTVPSGDGSSYTIQMDPVSHEGTTWTNQDYMAAVTRDAYANNPNIRVGVTLLYGPFDVISRIFTGPDDQKNADDFAANLVAYMKEYDLRAFDVDWESDMSEGTSQEQCAMFFSAIGAAFRQETEKFYLTSCPAWLGNMDQPSVSNNCDFVTLQIYGGARPAAFPQIDPQLFAYGMSTEMGMTAQDAVADNEAKYHFANYMNWRLNSENFPFQQSQQQVLYTLVKGSSSVPD